MKRLLLAIAAMMVMTIGVYAQKTQLYVSYGGYTQMDATDCHDGWHGVNNAWGALNAGVDFKVFHGLRLGPSYTFSSATTKGEHHSKVAYHAIMFNAKYDYYRNSIVRLYAHAGLGAVISHLMPRGLDAYNKSYFAYQLAPVGAEVGISRSAMIFGELGFGAQGLLQVGFRFNL
ncbi:MAG: outer membrane beta-barrel protein [Pseudoflavonifractor sp.]|nr:outer membrane beta-barrel protein [Alloprevotella sp.]MCM1117345.1 outer membrane beta-barrel protein [Pseudoflavonifractor sp.]